MSRSVWIDITSTASGSTISINVDHIISMIDKGQPGNTTIHTTDGGNIHAKESAKQIKDMIRAEERRLDESTVYDHRSWDM